MLIKAARKQAFKPSEMILVYILMKECSLFVPHKHREVIFQFYASLNDIS